MARLVVLESPFAGDVGKNIEYAKKCVRDSLMRGESPIASHLLLTRKGILDDNKPEERELGINAGLEWLKVADAHVFYTDLGISGGMKYALKQARKLDIQIHFRSIL